MSYYLIVTFSFSILLAGIIGLFRFSNIQPSYYPFLCFIWLGSLNETFSFLIVQNGGKSIVNNNVYVLAEALVIVYFFKVNHFLKKPSALLASLLVIAGWATEVFFRSIHEVGIYFRIGYSFLIVLISIETINRLLVSGEKHLLKNAMFLICVAFICYFTYKVLINTFWLYGLGKSMHLLTFTYSILVFINLFTNLIYALATLCIPRKPLSLLPS